MSESVGTDANEPGSTTVPTRGISASELRKIFNEQGYWERLNHQPYTRSVYSTHRPRHGDFEPGTVSQMFEFRLGQTKVALIHQYISPDGTSTMPDPKYLLHDGEILFSLKSP